MSYEVMYACSSTAVYFICYLYSTKQYIRDLKLNSGNTTFKLIQDHYILFLLYCPTMSAPVFLLLTSPVFDS